jgi:hypothetical protein
MARGKSGRIVLEVDPKLKRRLYFELEKQGLTLKDWFLKSADIFIENSKQIEFDPYEHYSTEKEVK